MFPGFPQSPIKIPVWLSIFSAPHRQRLSEPPRRSGTAGYPQCQHPLQGVGLCMGPRMGLWGCSHISVFPKELGARGSTAPSDKPTWVLLKEQGAEHGPILQTNLGAAISGARGFAQHPRVQPCIPSRGFCSGASSQLNLAGNRRRRVLCTGAGDAASMHTHGCRTPGSTAFPTALPISGSCWQSQSNAAALHTSRAEGYLSIAMTSAGALLLPLWVQHSPDLVKRLRRRSAELLSLSALTAPPGFDFKDCTHTEDPSQQQNAIGLQGTG